MIGEHIVFLYFLYVEASLLSLLSPVVNFKKRPAVTHNKINLLKFPLRSSFSQRTEDAFALLLLSPVGVPRPCVLTV